MTAQQHRDIRMGSHSLRRLSDKVLAAFHSACDRVDVEVAWEMLNALEFMMMRQPTLPAGRERRIRGSLVAAHERVEKLRRRGPPAL